MIKNQEDVQLDVNHTSIHHYVKNVKIIIMVRTAYCNVEIAPTELLVTKSTDLVKMSVVLTFYRLFAKTVFRVFMGNIAIGHVQTATQAHQAVTETLESVSLDVMLDGNLLVVLYFFKALKPSLVQVL